MKGKRESVRRKREGQKGRKGGGEGGSGEKKEGRSKGENWKEKVVERRTCRRKIEEGGREDDRKGRKRNIHNDNTNQERYMTTT